MGISRPLIILCCGYLIHASHDSHSYNIPVEGYKTELQNLGQHVDLHETPVKIIKITKTIAVKIPVPYPVKVIQKVPYPVHVSKPYPVPVPQIVKVPVPAHKDHGPNAHEALDVGQIDNDLHRNGNNYQVQENEQYGDEQSYDPSLQHQAYAGDGVGGHVQSFSSNSHGYEDPIGKTYEAPYHYGHDDGLGSAESNNYDPTIKGYLASAANQAHGNNFEYH